MTATYAPPVLDPDAVRISSHALVRYAGRRNSACAEAGLRRLIAKAARRPAPPLYLQQNGGRRRLIVSGFVLIFDADLSTLITLWRA